METIIHIGQHKTATSSIQKYLQANKQALKNQNVYFTDHVLKSNSPNHSILNVYSLAEERLSTSKHYAIKFKGSEYLKFLENNLPQEIAKIYELASKADCNRIIWSNEGLYLLNSIDEYKKLIDLFKPHSSKIVVVCCFRDKQSYLKSYKLQLDKQNFKTSQKKDSYKYVNEDTWLLDYQRKKILLSKVFDDQLYFEYNPVDNVKEFLDLLGIEARNTKSVRTNQTNRIRKKFPVLYKVYKDLKK